MKYLSEEDKAHDRFWSIMEKTKTKDQAIRHFDARTKRMTDPEKLDIWANVLKNAFWKKSGLRAGWKAANLRKLKANEEVKRDFDRFVNSRSPRQRNVIKIYLRNAAKMRGYN